MKLRHLHSLNIFYPEDIVTIEVNENQKGSDQVILSKTDLEIFYRGAHAITLPPGIRKVVSLPNNVFIVKLLVTN